MHFTFTLKEQYQVDKHACSITNLKKKKRSWDFVDLRSRLKVYLNYTGVACGCLWVDRESIRLENHCGWGEHSPKTTHEETGNSGRWEEKDNKGEGKARKHSEEQEVLRKKWRKRKKTIWSGQKKDPKGWGKRRFGVCLTLRTSQRKKYRSTRQSKTGKEGYSAV